MNDLTQQQGFNAPNFVMDSMLNSSMFEQMQRAATLFSKSGLVPGNFQNNPAACFVGLQLAGAIGCNPFMLFQGLYSISGKIALETKVAVAIANQKGVFTSPITHTFKGEGKTRSCTATATLTKSKKEVSITVDWDTVEKEGWNKKNGSKWNTMPDQMFRYRSSMWLIRTYAPEVLMGLNSLDEIEDSKLIDVTPIKTKKIDEVLAEIATTPKAEVLEQPQTLVEAPKTETQQPIETSKANEVEAKTTLKKDELISKVMELNIKPAALTVYAVKALGANKEVEALTEDEAAKLLSFIEAQTKEAK